MKAKEPYNRVTEADLLLSHPTIRIPEDARDHACGDRVHDAEDRRRLQSANRMSKEP
jgi:hypothetical protein